MPSHLTYSLFKQTNCSIVWDVFTPRVCKPREEDTEVNMETDCWSYHWQILSFFTFPVKTCLKIKKWGQWGGSQYKYFTHQAWRPELDSRIHEVGENQLPPVFPLTSTCVLWHCVPPMYTQNKFFTIKNLFKKYNDKSFTSGPLSCSVFFL